MTGQVPKGLWGPIFLIYYSAKFLSYIYSEKYGDINKFQTSLVYG